jgi:3',5'-cyclic AMP phosphodiesterase CpdA
MDVDLPGWGIGFPEAKMPGFDESEFPARDPFMTISPPSYERIVCISGDFTQGAADEELQEASDFLRELSHGFGWHETEARKRII